MVSQYEKQNTINYTLRVRTHFYSAWNHDVCVCVCVCGTDSVTMTFDPVGHPAITANVHVSHGRGNRLLNTSDAAVYLVLVFTYPYL